MAWSTRKITGLFGGSFDPVHCGHLHVCKSLLEHGVVEQVLFMPAAVSPHKQHAPPASDVHRLAMLELALEPFPEFTVSDYEISKGGVSYTRDTLQHFYGLYGEKLRMIIGMDSLHDLHLWYKSDELVRICPFITYCRPGSSPVREAELVERLGSEAGKAVFSGIVDAEGFAASSTDVKKAIKSGKFDKSLIPESVWCYIKAHGLYNY